MPGDSGPDGDGRGAVGTLLVGGVAAGTLLFVLSGALAVLSATLLAAPALAGTAGLASLGGIALVYLSLAVYHHLAGRGRQAVAAVLYALAPVVLATVDWSAVDSPATLLRPRVGAAALAVALARGLVYVDDE